MNENLLARAGYRGPKFSVDPDNLPAFKAPVAPPMKPTPLPVLPVMYQLAPGQRQADTGGWANALGTIGASLLSRVLARRRATPQDDGHTSPGHLDEPIIAPQDDSTGIGGEHEAGFATGGVIDDSLVGRKLKFGENEPEAIVDEAGRVQVITKPTVGVATRPALVVPFSHLQQAASALGQSLPAPDYKEVYAGPRFNPSQFNEQADNLTRSSIASIGNGKKPSTTLEQMLAQKSYAGPRPPVPPAFSASSPAGLQTTPQTDVPQAEMRNGFKEGFAGPGLALTRDDTHNINQFASPSVRATVAPKSGYGSPQVLGYAGPRPPFDPNAQMDRSLTPTTQQAQQTPATNDAATIPVDQRREAISAASDEASPPARAASSQTVVQPATEQSSATSQRRAQLEQELAKLYGLENTKAVDKNGRLKSTLLGILRGGLQGFAQTGTLGGLAGGALGGGLTGVVHPAWDEELKQVAAINRQRGKVSQALAIEKELGQLDEMQSRSEAARAKNSPDALASASHTRKMREVTTRLRAMGGTWTPGRDQQLDALIAEMGMSPKRAGGGGGFNPQKLKVVGGNLVYVEHPDLPPVVLYTAGMNEADRQRNAIALEQVNTWRKRNGDPPLMFASDLEGETLSAPPQTPQTSTPQNPPATYSGPRPPSENPAPTTQRAPSTSSAPQSSVLVPVPGAKATPPVYQRRARRAASGGARRDSIGDSLAARDAARYNQEAANARAQAQAARARGEDDVAQSWETAARTADENARKVGQRRGAAQRNTPAPKKGDPLGILD